MAHVIIGIHGLGNKPPQKLLQKWWKLAMIEGLKTYNHKAILPKFELVYWADILYDKPLNESETDKHSPYFLDEKYTTAPKDVHEEHHTTRRKVMDFLGKQINHIFLNEDLSRNYSYITDIVVEKYFKDLDVYLNEKKIKKSGENTTAKEIINKRLSDVLEKHKDDKIFLISHSMGSIIAFDVLKFNSSHIPVSSFITMGSPLGLPLVISKINEKQKERETPGKHIRTPSTVLRWCNFSDITDTVAFNYKLADDFAENDKGIKPEDFLVVNNYTINGKENPHKSYGYLRTPEFANLLNRFIQTEELNLFQLISRKAANFIYTLKRRFSR